MFAIVRSGGKQLRVEEGARVRVEKLEGAVGDPVQLDEVLLVRTNDGLRIGTPTVEGARVEARIVEQGRARKILVFKYRRRKNYRRRKGHRQPFTALEIQSISA